MHPSSYGWTDRQLLSMKKVQQESRDNPGSWLNKIIISSIIIIVLKRFSRLILWIFSFFPWHIRLLANKLLGNCIAYKQVNPWNQSIKQRSSQELTEFKCVLCSKHDWYKSWWACLPSVLIATWQHTFALFLEVSVILLGKYLFFKPCFSCKICDEQIECPK